MTHHDHGSGRRAAGGAGENDVQRNAERFASVGGFTGAVLGARGGPVGAGIGALVGGSAGYALGYALGRRPGGSQGARGPNTTLDDYGAFDAPANEPVRIEIDGDDESVQIDVESTGDASDPNEPNAGGADTFEDESEAGDDDTGIDDESDES